MVSNNISNNSSKNNCNNNHSSNNKKIIIIAPAIAQVPLSLASYSAAVSVNLPLLHKPATL